MKSCSMLRLPLHPPHHSITIRELIRIRDAFWIIKGSCVIEIGRLSQFFF